MEKFTIRINSRQVLFNTIKQANISSQKRLSVIQSIDKLDKKSKAEVSAELKKKGLSSDQVNRLFSTLSQATPDDYLTQVIKLAQTMGVAKNNIRFDPTLARGLDYYTGPIFETVVTKPNIGSISGGGRYDNLINQLGGPDWPAVGVTLGLDRICDVIAENKLWPDLSPTSSQVLVTVFSSQAGSQPGSGQTGSRPAGTKSMVDISISLTDELRDQGINAETYLNPSAKLDQQIKYADRKGIPFVVILGPKELDSGTVTVKDMKTGKQKTVPLAKLPKLLQNS
jgi:histidyl-tRNA synthetase